jgi:hypothetical protein
MSKRQILALVSLLVAELFLSASIKAQAGLVDPRKTEYICVLSRVVNFTADQDLGGAGIVKANGTVEVLPCEAANVRQDRLIDADYAALEKMQLQRILFDVLKARPNSDTEARSTRSDFLKSAKEVCQRHPKIALLSLDWKSEQPTEGGGVSLKTCGVLRMTEAK